MHVCGPCCIHDGGLPKPAPPPLQARVSVPVFFEQAIQVLCRLACCLLRRAFALQQRVFLHLELLKHGCLQASTLLF